MDTLLKAVLNNPRMIAKIVRMKKMYLEKQQTMKIICIRNKFRR